MSGCFGCGGLQPEVKLLNDCYPPSKALATSGPDYKPLSSDLSKLTYRCTNQSSKLAKVGEELDKRVQKEAVRSTGGYAKSRASLLISLAILRALISECRRDLTLFTRSIIRIINSALEVKVYQKGEPDLEVIGRAASCFIAFTTYSDGSAVSTDDALSNTYLSVLRKFGTMATTRGTGEKPDQETINRTRLIGLAALNGAASSDCLFASNSETPRQIDIVVPALLLNIFGGSMNHLKVETARIEMDASPSPFFTEFSARRPATDRRAPSLYAHIPGEKGPADDDVLSAALRSLHALIRQAQVNQASHVLDAVFHFLDKIGWNDVERCCWLAERLAAFISLQYRFVVPTRLVETLVDLPDGDAPTTKQMTILAMVTTILNSSISLVGLGVTDLLNNLVTLVVRRIHFDQTDALLPPLVQSISSLGTHIYYADQINDIIADLALRIAEIPQTDKSRPEILRVLIYSIIGVMNTAVAADVIEARATAHQESLNNGDKGKAPALETPLEPRRTGRRNAVTSEVWQETLALLCESTYAVRATYARALILFLVNEQNRETRIGKHDSATYRFCNALHAAVYTLAMSSCLGTESPIPTPRDSPVVTSTDIIKAEAKEDRAERPDGEPKSESKAGEKGVSFNLTEPTPNPTPTPGDSGTGTSTPIKTQSRRGSRRVSLPLNRINSSMALSSFENVATPFDFAVIIKILDELHAAVPIAALRTGIPMLLALDQHAVTGLVRAPGNAGAWISERKRAIKEVVAIVWRHIGDRWGAPSIIEAANKALNALPEPFEVPNPALPPPGILPPPEQATQFFPHTTEGESSNSIQPMMDPEFVIASLAGSRKVLDATGMDSAQLINALSAKWTVENAIKNSIERFSSAHPKPADDTHFDVANVLMSMNNPSYQSFNRPTSRAIDVTDLREALGGGRVDGNSPSGPPSIISTTTAAKSFRDANVAGHGQDSTNSPKRRTGQLTGAGGGVNNSSDVQEVLKDIFKGSKSKKKQAHAHAHGLTHTQGQGHAPGTMKNVVNANGDGVDKLDEGKIGGGTVNGNAIGLANGSGTGSGSGSGGAANGGIKTNAPYVLAAEA